MPWGTLLLLAALLGGGAWWMLRRKSAPALGGSGARQNSARDNLSQYSGGPRDNLAFEGLALTPDQRTAWVAMENALLQDGPSPRVGAEGGPCRITAFDLASGQAVRQIAYVPDAIPARGPLPRRRTSVAIFCAVTMEHCA